jgi:hypothetical protein
MLCHMDWKTDRPALYLLCVARAGLEAPRLIAFIEEWRRCVEFHDREVNIEEFIAWTRRFPRRMTFRRLRLFRDTFPQLGEDGLPSGLMGPLLERLAAEAEAELEAR